MRRFFLLLILAAGICPKAWAASDGAPPGPYQEGSTLLTLEVSKLVRITGMRDLTFATGGTTNFAVSDNYDLCVYTNHSTGQYRVSGLEQGATSDFIVSDGTHELKFVVKFNDQIGKSDTDSTTLTVNQQPNPTVQTGANTESMTCTTGGKSANLEIIFARKDIMSVPAGTYVGVISIVIDPV